jgi:hypothetical protein
MPDAKTIAVARAYASEYDVPWVSVWLVWRRRIWRVEPTRLDRYACAGINDAGQSVGWYANSTAVHGLLATPIPEPSALLLLAIGTVGVIGWARWRAGGIKGHANGV